MVKCRNCGASDTMSLRQAVGTMMQCNNCRVDIAPNGQWTGDAIKVIKALITAYGNQAVAAEFDSCKKKTK